MRRSTLFVVALISFSLMASELAWTRIFTAEFYYTFAFLILSMAVLGLGLGALAARLLPDLKVEQHLANILMVNVILSLIGPPLVFVINPEFSLLLSSFKEIAKLLSLFFILASTFFAGGMALAIIFREEPKEIPRMYMADLFGAAAGAVGAILLMNWFSTPVAVFLNTLPLIFGAFLLRRTWDRSLPVLLLIPLTLLMMDADRLLKVFRPERAPVSYTHWDAQSKIKIYDYDEDFRGLNIDNVANSPVYGFDGNWDRPDSMQFQFGIDAEYLIQQNDSCTFLSLGAGGGVDVLQALQYGATEVHAVEILRHINDLMTSGLLADFSGHIYDDPRVQVFTSDARSHVRKYRDYFDMIYSLSSNTFTALTSGAFAMAENYLFTEEAFGDYWRALSPTGFMMMEHQFYIPRLVPALMQALEKEGITNPESYFAVYNLPAMHRNMILLSRQPLTEEIRHNAFGPLTAENFPHIHLLYPPADSLQDNLINKIVKNGWENMQAEAAVNLAPTTDNQPFIAQLGLWRNLTRESINRMQPYDMMGFPLSKLILLTILILAALVFLPLTLLPLGLTKERLGWIPAKYFGLLGMGFMSLEIILIQQYGLLLESSLESMVTVLLSLLLFSGLGSRLAPKFPDWVPFIVIPAWCILNTIIFAPLTMAIVGWPLLLRILMASLLLAPLGFFMGMPFPKGVLRIGSQVDWALAINGISTVLGSALTVFIAFHTGFSMVLIGGGILYLMAGILLAQHRNW